MASFETIIPKLTDHTDCGVGGRQYGPMIVDLWSATRSWPQTLLWEITPDKSASVYECFPFTWPYNAQPVLLKNSTRSRSQGRNGDYTSKWIVFLMADQATKWQALGQ
jgi:hypothetical protein